jgi:putative acetyltransferase
MERSGPHGKEAPHSKKKVCIVATDLKLLADLLYGLSLRQDCNFVKYGTIARDGMYLGRCFMQTDRLAAELCEQLKHHARLMVSIQDDGFFNAHREGPEAKGGCGIWDDGPHEAAAVDEVHTRAFGRPDEAAMVAAVRASRAPCVSLVAGHAAGESWVRGKLVGHVLLSPVTIDGRDEPRGLGLAPLAVVPDQQCRDVGTQLVKAALRRAQVLGYAYAVVLGDPRYYGRFGFLPASRLGLRYEHSVPEEAFMALELREGGLGGASGVVRYLPAFSASSK